MSNIIDLPIRRLVYVCGKCDYDLFRLADNNGDLIAICDDCGAPVVPLSCSCLINKEST